MILKVYVRLIGALQANFEQVEKYSCQDRCCQTPASGLCVFQGRQRNKDPFLKV